MAKIGLSAGFDPIPTGIHVLKIKSVDDSKYESFGKIMVTLVDKAGHSHIERFSFYDKDGVQNDPALWSFSGLARAALDLADDDMREVEATDLVGKYIRCEVTHEEVESKTKPGEYRTYSRLGREKTHAEGFEGAAVKPAPAKAEAPSGADPYDLGSILG